MEIPDPDKPAMPNISDYVRSVSKAMDPRDIWLLSDELIVYVEIINFVIICGALSLFGIVTNILNILVFIRLGFKETINISLFGLAISDFCSLITLLWVSICYNPLLRYAGTDIFFLSFEHYTGVWPHVTFTRITGFITIFITIERCFCIAFPLKIKDMMTPKRVKLIIIAIYVIIIASMVPNYFTFTFGWEFVLSYNRSMFGVVYFDNVVNIEMASQFIQIFYIVTSFTLISLSTAFFVLKLSQKGKWRQAVTGGKDTTATRDQQIIKMVICVAAIFFFSYIPSLLLTIAFASSPDVDIGKKYHNLCVLLMSLTYPAEAINSSVNIFIYYKMMSKYKAVFRSMICKASRLRSKACVEEVG